MLNSRIAACTIACSLFLVGGTVAAQEVLFQSKRLTSPDKFTRHIEGPAVDAAGNLYVPNLGEDGTIGKLAPGAAEFELFAKLPPPPPTHDGKISISNGIRFDREGRMYIADFNRNNIFVIEAGEKTPRGYFSPDQSHEPKFNQPNDLAIAADGTLYASDPHFKTPASGRIWRITRGPDGMGRGEIMPSSRPMGTTNGLDLSPDGKTLYVAESNTRKIWSYRIDGNKLVDHTMVKQFPIADDSEVDGLRTDVDGRIFLARLSAGKIVIIKPNGTQEGTVVREVLTTKKGPNNLTFGGPDGRTVFVTQSIGKYVESFRTDRPGREPCMQVPSKC